MPRIRCSVTGLHYSVTTNHRKELIEKFGSEEALAEKYVSRDGRRLIKEGKTVEEIRAMVERGELGSKTEAPKRNGSVGRPRKVKAGEVPAENAEPADAEINKFLAKK